MPLRMTEVSDFFSLFDGPALVVTAQSDAGRSGCLVAFATQCSIYPPRLLVCLSVVNLTTTVASRARALGVHVLRRDQQRPGVAFWRGNGDEIDKLSDVAWREGLAGAPILEECSAWLEGIVLERFPLGDHVGYLLEVIDVASDLDHDTMLKSEVMGLEPGHPAEEVASSSGRRSACLGSEVRVPAAIELSRDYESHRHDLEHHPRIIVVESRKVSLRLPFSTPTLRRCVPLEQAAHLDRPLPSVGPRRDCRFPAQRRTVWRAARPFRLMTRSRRDRPPVELERV